VEKVATIFIAVFILVLYIPIVAIKHGKGKSPDVCGGCSKTCVKSGLQGIFKSGNAHNTLW
jgi:hypothetical protein